MIEATSTRKATGGAGIDLEAIRRQFPILHQEIHGKRLAFLDSAASSQKPIEVIEAIAFYYTYDHANVHRGVHTLSQRATEAYEAARRHVQRALNAAREEEVVFVRGTTEAINLVAATWGRKHLGEGDEIVLTEMEHHSNIVPWQLLAEQTGSTIRVVRVDDRGVLDMDQMRAVVNPRTKLVSVVHVSNALGTVNPVEEIIAIAKSHGARVLLDGAQAVPHQPVDVQALGCDFYAFSGHKAYGPTGIGALYGRYELLQEMPPYHGGGDMVRRVSFEKTTYADPPSRFEAGTPNIAGAVGLGAAVQWMAKVGVQRIHDHEAEILAYGTQRLAEIPGLRLIGTSPNKAGVLSFVIDDIHPQDIGTMLDMAGVAVRTGHHCAEPVMNRFGITATTRASLAVYNGRDDIDALIDGLRTVVKIFGR